MITTVRDILVDFDLGRSLARGDRRPRASQRDGTTTTPSSAFVASPDAQALQAGPGREFARATQDPPAEIGAATGIEF